MEINQINTINDIKKTITYLKNITYEIECDDYANIENYSNESFAIINAIKFLKAILVSNYEVKEENLKVGDFVCLNDSIPDIDKYDYGIITSISKDYNEIYIMRKDGSCMREDISNVYKLDKEIPEINDLLKKIGGAYE